MIKRLTGWFVLLPLGVVLVLLALANRHTVTIGFDPLGTEPPVLAPVSMPMFVLIYALLIVGVVLGGLAAWFAQGRHRREERRLKREANRLEAELEQARNASHRDEASALLDGPVSP